MTDATAPFLSFVVDTAGDTAVAGPLRLTIASLRRQDDPGWELVVSGAEPGFDPAGGDARVRVLPSGSEQAAVRAQEAIDAISGEFVTRLDPGGRVAPQTVSTLRALAEEVADLDVAYSHERRRLDGRARDLHKPAWSPQRLLGHDWTGRLSVFRAATAREALQESGLTAAHEHDLALRMGERSRSVRRIDQFLYEGEASGVDDLTWDGAVAAVEAHCMRTGLHAEAERGPVRGTVRLLPRLPSDFTVTVIVPTDGRRGMAWGERRRDVVGAVRSVLGQGGHPGEVLVVHSAETPPEAIDELSDIDSPHLRMLAFPGGFDFVAMANAGVLASSTQSVVLLDQRTEVDGPDFLPRLLGPLLDPGVGLTAPRVVRDGVVRNGGVALYRHRFREALTGWPDAGTGPSDLLAVTRECSAVDGTCVALRTETFHEVGGLSTRFPAAYAVDLSAKTASVGLRRVWVADARLRLWATLPSLADLDDDERKALTLRWAGPEVDDFLPMYGAARAQSAQV